LANTTNEKPVGYIEINTDCFKNDIMEPTFLGRAGTLTGLHYIVSDEEHRLPEGCSMHQRVQSLHLRNPCALFGRIGQN
jgi:hypothetical protein